MIRSFHKKDTDAVMNIWLEATIKGHFFIEEGYWRKAEKVVLEEYIPTAETYVYIKGRQIIGFVSILSEDTIGALFVDPKYFRKGVGKSLVDYVKQKFDFLSVSTYKKNLNARAFYEKQGFVFDYEQNDLNTGEIEYVYIWDKATT